MIFVIELVALCLECFQYVLIFSFRELTVTIINIARQVCILLEQSIHNTQRIYTQRQKKQVKHVPEMRMSLIFMGRLDDEGYSTSFGRGGWKISKGALVVAKGPKT